MFYAALVSFLTLLEGLLASSWGEIATRFIPFALFLELPLMLIVMVGIYRYAILQHLAPIVVPRRFLKVSCVITCYSEKEDVQYTLQSLASQIYPGDIEIIAVVDGAIQNAETLTAARRHLASINAMPGRKLIVLPKWQRGGRVSSLNSGRSIANGEIIMALDGDTSFDNDMVYNAVTHFRDPNVIAVAGNLRVRNAAVSFVTRMQALEYLISIGGGKTGLAAFNVVNNISGAFGVFRADVLSLVGGWDAGTAEDLDMTQRLKQYFGRYGNYRIVFDPKVVGHTDAPTTVREFFWQRLRWDGDLFYIYVRKYRHNLRPSLLGWKNFLSHLITGILFQIVMPFLILLYSAYLFLTFDTGLVIGILFFVYLAYLAVLIMFFTLYWLVVSERPKSDARYFLYLPVYPFFAYFERISSTIGLLHEMFNRGHLDSAMAPWWVLRKTKF
jgi:biofilm PGA synthesis N-glycosyltransferase PgaC